MRVRAVRRGLISEGMESVAERRTPLLSLQSSGWGPMRDHACISPEFVTRCHSLQLKLMEWFNKQAINDMVRIFSSGRLTVK